MKRIDLFIKKNVPYSYEAYFARCLNSACRDYDIDCRLHALLEGNFSELLSKILSDPPQLTISFNEICLAKPDSLLCDMLKIPHLFWMGKNLSSAFFYLKSPYGIVGSQDFKHISILKNLGGKKIFNLPQVTFDTPSTATNEKSYDTVIFGSLIDLNEFIREGKELFSVKDFDVFQKSVDDFHHRKKLPIESLIYVIEREGIDVSEICFTDLLYQLENYVKANEIDEWVRSFTYKSLHVFGWHRGKNLLNKISPEVHLHSDVHYTEKFKILSRSKHALFGHALMPEGVDDLFLRSFIEDCIPLSIKNSCLKENFAEFTVDDASKFEKKIEELGRDNRARERLLDEGKLKVKENYSIDKAMRQILLFL